MSVSKITKYSPVLHELRASWGLLQASKHLLSEAMQHPARYEDFFTPENDLAELSRIERKLDHLFDEIKATELLHEAAILTGNYEEYVQPRRFR